MTKFPVYCCLLMAVFLLGCSNSQPQDTRQEFFDKWQQVAAESQGYSPEQDVEAEDLGEETFESMTVQEDQDSGRAADRPLPTQPVTLNLQNPTPLRTVLRLLSKGADQNLVISPKVQGEVQINIKEVPWADAFETILKNHGYTYTWEGDVLRVITLDDLEQERKIKEKQAQAAEKTIEAQNIVRSARETKVVKVKYADLEQIQKTLIQALGGEDDNLDDLSSSQASENETLPLLPDADGEEQTRSQQIRAVAPKGSVIADPFSNSLIIRAGRQDMDMLMNLFRYLDKPPQQVNIRAHIVEATKEAGRYLGIQWGGAYSRDIGSGDSVWALPGGTSGSTSSDPVHSGSSGSGDNGDGDGGYTSLFGPGLSGQGLGLNFPADMPGGRGSGIDFLVGEIGENILEVQLSALEEQKMAHILSSPSITTMDHQQAFLEQGQEVPYETDDDEGDTNVEFKDATLRLEITPHIIDSNQMRLQISIKKDEVDKTFDVKGNPLINRKETSTSLIVHDNETVVISGLTKETSGDNDYGVPWLKDIPGLGRLFKGDSRTTQMDELLIFITPQLLKKRSEAQALPHSGLSPRELQELKPTGHPQARVWEDKSRDLLESKDWNEAVRTASIAIVLDPALPGPYITRSLGLLEQDQAKAAHKDARTACHLEDKNPRAHLALGRALQALGHKDKALEHFARSCGLGNEQGCREHKKLFDDKE
ncbi:MAG: type IV pilus secretin PilQ [Desulfovermiculus sp.]